MTQKVLIIGATSGMAEAAARFFAKEGAELSLVGRDKKALESLAADLSLRGAAQVQITANFDALRSETWIPSLESAWAALEKPDYVLVSYGFMPEQEACAKDTNHALDALTINFSSVAALCLKIAEKLVTQGTGTLGVISSVAGLRGRQSNFIYGSAKGGLSIFLQGLRNSLHPKGIRVVTFLPGFVDTAMTAHLDQGPLFVSAETAGRILHRSLTRSKGDVVYIPFFWRYILWVIRAIPEKIFKRLKL